MNTLFVFPSIFINARKSILFILLLLFATTNTIAANYYWVGGSGNWSDYGSHWATSSGGNVFHTSIPDPTDDVFFDANSFTATGQKVTLNNTLIYCKDMNWNGVLFNPTLDGLNSILNIYGSIELVQAMTWKVKRTNFSSNNLGNTILSSGHAMDTLYFPGTGSYELLDSLSCSAFYYQSVTFKTNDHSIATGHFKTTFNFNSFANLDLGSSTIYCGGEFSPTAANSTLSSSNSSIIFQTHPLYFNIINKTLSSSSQSFKSVEFQGWGYMNGAVVCQELKAFGNVHFVGGPSISYINNLLLDGDATLNLILVTDSLRIIKPGSLIKLRDITVNDYWESNGNCTNSIVLQPVSGVSTAIIRKSSGSVLIDHCSLSSIQGTGGASFTASNSFDLGGNTGWSIVSPLSRSLYWVGGAGNWNDSSHWSTSSGGPGGSCAPNFTDDVIFDANSFVQLKDSIKITMNVQCRNLTINGAGLYPVFESIPANTTISIGGSFIIQDSVHFTSQYVTFSGPDTGKVFQSSGSRFQMVTHLGPGDLSLSDPLYAGMLRLYGGTFNSNGHYMNLGSLFTSGAWNPTTVNLGTSDIDLTEVSINKVNSILNSSNAKLNITDIPDWNGYPQNVIQFMDGSIWKSVTVGKYSTFRQNFICDDFLVKAKMFATQIIAQKSVFHNNVAINRFETDSLILMPTVTTLAVDTLNITSHLENNNSCSDPLTINKFQAFQQAQLTVNINSFNLSNAYISGFNNAGPATINTSNCWDLGNNTGWNFQIPIPRSLYWVGNGGDWQDQAHWALSSGGLSGNCPPLPTDSVYFDSASFTMPGQTITIGSNPRKNCKNLTFTGVVPGITFDFTQPPLNGFPVTVPLEIYGSLELQPGINMVMASLILSSPDSGNTINTGTNFIKSITTRGAGEYSLSDSLFVNELNTDNYLFRTNNHNIHASSYLRIRNLFDMGSSKIKSGSFEVNSPNPLIYRENVSIIIPDLGFFKPYPFDNYYKSITFGDNTSAVGNFSCRDLKAEGNITLTNAEASAEYAEFKGSFTSTKPFSADSIIFNNPGKTIRISQLNASNHLQINGSSGFPVQLEGYPVSGTINSSANMVCLDHVFLKNITATGGAQFFTGANAIDLGGNSGWTFGACTPLTDVWPGDVNYDLVVNNFDILNIGVAYGYSATTRANASTQWVAQPSVDWPYQFANFANLKHADTDGNGVVNAADTMAVTLNYGLTHPFRIPQIPQNNLPSPLLYISGVQDSVQASDTALVDIYLGNATTPVDSIYGIAFSLNFDSTLVKPNYLNLDFNGCWLGDPQSNLLTYSYNIMNSGRVDLAIVRTNQQDTSGFGMLLRAGVVIVDNIGARLTMPVWLSDVRAITLNEFVLNIQNENDSIILYPKTTGIDPIFNSDPKVHLFPNPARDHITVYSDEHILKSYEIFDINGKKLQQDSIQNSSAQINTGNLPNGILFIKIVTDKHVSVQKIQIVRN